MTDDKGNTETKKINSIECDGAQFAIDGKQISKIVVNPCSFQQFGEASKKARENYEKPQKQLTRELMKTMARCVTSTGEQIVLTDMIIMQMPIPYALDLKDIVESNQSEQGKVISEGNGVDTPILFRLGTPIKVGKSEVIELEFQAKSFGDIEDAVAAGDAAEQAMEMIRLCAKPIGKDLNLSAFPDSAFRILTAEDGIAITRDVVPAFLG